MNFSQKSVSSNKVSNSLNTLLSWILGVVVIDDQPEVTIDDPAFLFENNEGFQEVTSKKAAKAKQKIAAEELKKTDAPTPPKLVKKESSSGKVSVFDLERRA